MRWALIVAMVGCRNHAEPDRGAELPTLAELARTPDELDAAADPHLDEAARVAALETWAEHGGRIVVPTAPTDTFVQGRELAFAVAARIAKDKPDDDRALEAALYAAQRLRRDNPTLLRAMLSTGITIEAIRHRAHPPAFAARYAPTDAEVVQALAGEALYSARAHAEHPDAADPWPSWAWLATEPRDRSSVLSQMFQHLPPWSMYSGESEMAVRMYIAVDDYQRWLAR
ncbi:MAG TPA: hypothetical protein VMJ10_01780 [Kofleriaceae bacterium]|nr:hypothetical protein [Kofleriaceae bacterium]